MDSLGILSLIPPLLAIGLAIYTKDVIISLVIAVVVAATMACGGNPYEGGITILQQWVFPNISDSTNAQSIIMLMVVGGFTELITRSGSGLAFTNVVTKGLNSRPKCEVAMWISGLFIWFTDLGNSLIVGPIFEKVGDKLKVSREKFAYILDCTTSPICALVPIVGFGIYIMGLIDVELEAASITGATSWDLFLSSAPFNFYTVLTLVMCGYMAITQFDFGPMLKAQNRAKYEGKLLKEGSVPMRKTQEIVLPEGVEPKMSTMLAPIAVLLIVIFFEMFRHGFPFAPIDGTVTRTAIMWGFLLATVLLIILCVINKVMTFKECMDTMMKGYEGMMYMSVVLVLAWALGSGCKAIGTANYMVQITSGFLNPGLLPVLMFIIGAIMSLATGTSWGTMAILMPIAFPMALAFNMSLPVIIGSVVSGGLFGDHISPISDTTIMASMGAACDHIDHFETQAPYGFVCAAVSAVGFLISGFMNNWTVLLITTVILFVLIFILHKIDVKRFGTSSGAAKPANAAK